MDLSELPYWIITILIIGAFMGGMMIVATTLLLPMPSDDTCHNYNEPDFWYENYYSPEYMFCEQNETGWHFNGTAFRAIWDNATLI